MCGCSKCAGVDDCDDCGYKTPETAMKELTKEIIELREIIKDTKSSYHKPSCPIWQCGGYLEMVDMGGEEGWKTPYFYCLNCKTKFIPEKED